MSDQQHIMDSVRKEVRSLLMPIKEGLTPAQLEREYLCMIGKPLPLHILGYRCMMELVMDMPDVVSVYPCRDGSVILKAIADEATRGIANLVARQKTSSKVRSTMQRANAFSRCSLPRRGRTPPILPAVVKSELKQLLGLSPVLLSDFDKAFARRFGRTFQYMRYGFFSMMEVLSAASDIIAIEQTRAGSLLILKNSPSAKKQQEKLSQGEYLMWGQVVLSSTCFLKKNTTFQGHGWLEKAIKMTLAEKGAGGTVSRELKEKIRVVSIVHIWKCEYFKERLPVKELGFLNVMEFVGALNDILHVECQEDKQDWLVFDLKSKCLHQVLLLLFLSLQYLEMEEQQLAWEIAEPEIPPDAVQNRRLYCLPALDSSTLVGAFVEYIISPSQFYIRIYSRETSEMLEDMMIEMRRCYSNKNVSDRYIMPKASVQPGHLCCVRISEDKWWYRVIIHQVLNEQQVEVFFLDFGNLGTVQKSCLRFLKCCYSKLPAQAIPCSLAWVKPIEGHWTTNAVLRFQKLCNLKPLVGVVDEYVNGILHLFLCDTTSEEDIYIHQVLRAEGHAVVCRENIPSKVKKHRAGKFEQDYSLADSSDPAVLSKSRGEFYISLIRPPSSAEPSQVDPHQNEISPSKVQLLTVSPASASLTAASVSLDNRNGEVIQEKVKSEEISKTQVFPLSSRNSYINRGAEEQNSLLLAAELQVSQKLYIPRSSPTAALGAAARLATSRGLFHWLSVQRKLET
uniref:Tudor domain-containing protein 5 n=1 Tax=Pelusios castaneus TaxID=367368 RepID=A0A8C8RDM6_9SAUR